MCDVEEPSSPNESDESKTQLSLQDLPVEIFLYICSFLDSSTLVYGLSLVCKRFNQILKYDLLWKVRISQIWPNTHYPILPPVKEEESFWKFSCLALEKQAAAWKNKESMETLTLTKCWSSTVDSLLLMDGGKICISGSRDRSLVYWKLPADKNTRSEPASTIHQAHSGWIWDLTAIDNTVYSCSWDQSVKAWTLTNSGLVHLKTYETNISSALLCVASCPDLAIFATGSFLKKILVFDSRSGQKPIARYQPHERPVLRLSMSPRVILSISEDSTLSIWDQRTRRVMKKITISNESYPMSMCVHSNMVYVGTSNATLHVLDSSSDFEVMKSYPTQHANGITGVRATSGCLITGSKDQTVRISSPTDPPQDFTTLTWSYREIARIDYLNEVLAISGRDCVQIWRPKTGSS